MIVWDANRVDKGLATVSPLRLSLLLHVKELLDNYHGASRTVEYYDILLGNWVEQFLHLVYFAFSEITEQAADTPARSSPVISIEADPLSFILRTVDSPQLTDDLRYAVYLLVSGAGVSEVVLRESPVHHVRRGMKARSLSAVLDLASPKKPDVLICSPYLKSGRRGWITALLRWRRKVRWDDLEYPIRWEAESDQRWRLSQASAHSKSSDVLGIAKTLSSLYIPKLYLEGFVRFRSQVLGLNLPRPRAVYSANALNWNATFKTLAAEWREQGTRLLYHQHGGGYGIDKQNVAEDYEVRVADRYYTWGWRHASPNVVPLAPPFPAICRAGPDQARWNVLLVCLETSRIPYRLWYQPMPGTMELVIGDTVEFVSRLNNPQGLLVRLAPKSFGWGMRDAIAEKVPATQFDDFSASSFQRFSESQIVVHNYLGTSWLETLAANVPTVCFFSPTIQAFRQEAATFVQALEEIGILHRSGAGAASFVQSLGNEVEAWWDSDEVQSARRAFVSHYANFSTDWIASWEAEFDSVS